MKATGMSPIHWGVAIVLAALALPCAMAGAADAAPPKAAEAAAPAPTATADRPEKDWQFELSLYGWLSAVSTTLRKGDVDTSTYMSFGDILHVLDFAGFLHLEAQHGKWGLFSELDYVKLSGSSQVRVPRIPLVRLDAGGGLKETIAELGGMRSFDGDRVGFDILGGARYIGMKVDATLGPLDMGADKDWVDPFVGGRLRFRLSEKWGMSLRGDAGGFGLGSDVTYNAAAVLRYQISKSVAMGIGYRYLDINYDKNGLNLDSTTYGPVIGVAYTF